MKTVFCYLKHETHMNNADMQKNMQRVESYVYLFFWRCNS